MANQLELNVLYVNTNPLKEAQTASVTTSDILVYEIISISGVNSGIQYYNNQSNLLAYEIYYSDQSIGDLLTAGNTAGTSLVQVPVISKNDAPFPVAVSFLFPADGIKLTEVDGGTQIEFKNDFYLTTDNINSIIAAANAATSNGYKVYTALLTQTGVTPPTAKVLDNTIGNIFFTYISDGNFRINSAGLFTANKTWTNPTFCTNIIPNVGFQMYRISDNQIVLFDSSMLNNGLNNTSIEIRVYN